MMDLSFDTPLAFLNTIFASFERLHPAYLLVTVVLAAGLYWRERLTGAGKTRSFIQFIAPRGLYNHPSAILDYKIFAVLKLAVPLVFLIALGSLGGLFADHVVPVMHVPADRHIGVIVAYTVASIMAYDFARYLSHRMFHEVPLLWEFHKVHHSAQVLTPITNFRFHPVEMVVNGVFGILGIGFATAVFNGLFGAGLTVVEILGVNAMQVLFHITGSNLRHSHIWLSYGPVIEHLFVSPAQHQIHHSAEDRHLDRNYGFQFALWDWALGSLYVPKGREQFRIGLANPAEEAEHDTLARTWGLPFKRAYEIIQQRSHPAAAE